MPWVKPVCGLFAVSVVCVTFAYAAKQPEGAKMFKQFPSAIWALGGLFS